jgi:CubicO group peptidase (beta-lactamase class C family)
MIGAGACAAALAWAVVASAKPVTYDNVARAALDSLANDATRWRLTPSLSLAIVQNGKIVYAAARGSADLENNVGAGVDTRYPIGSMGTLFLAVAVIQLDAKGKLHLDDALSRYLPRDRGASTTLRGLLAPQEGNANYDALGAVVERVTGTALRNYVAQHVFRPAGMSQTSVAEPPSPVSNISIARGYYEWRDDFGMAQPDAEASDRKCCGFVSTARDLARFDIALLDGRLIPAASLSALRRSFQFTNHAGMSMIGRTATLSGYDAENLIVMSRRFAIITLANCAGFSAPAVLDRALAVFYPRAVAAHASPERAADSSPAITARLRRFLVAQHEPGGAAGGMTLLSSSVSGRFTEYRYLVDFSGVTKAAFFVLTPDEEIDGFWLH